MRVLKSIVIVVIIVLGAGWLFRDALVMRVMENVVLHNLRTNLLATLPDGLHVALCGTGSPMPDPKRAGPCVAVIAGKSLFIVDTGSGAVRNLRRMGLPAGQVKAVFLTHFHSDHIDGLGELATMRWVGAANTAPLPTYGPAGVDQVVAGFNQAYQLDTGYRHAHHGDAVAPLSGKGLKAMPFEVPADGSPVTVWDADGLRVAAFAVDHAPISPAVGYRFDYAGRSLVLSGDTRKTASVERAAKGVDLLVHEALNREMVALLNRAAQVVGDHVLEKATHDIPGYHASPVEAAEVAQAAGVGALVYYHIVPPLPMLGMEHVFLHGVDSAYTGKVVLGYDGLLVSLPAGGKAINFSNAF